MDEQNKGVRERWAPTERDARGYAGDSGSAGERGYAAGEGGADDRIDERRTTEIRADIESTREDMRETIDAIQDRLRPGNVVSRAAESVREATVGRMKHMASSVQGAMPSRTIGAGNPVVDRIRDNPVPAALAALSLAWLAFGGRRRSADYSAYDYRNDYRGRNDYRRASAVGSEWYDDSLEAPFGYEGESRATRPGTGRGVMSHAGSAAQDAGDRVQRVTRQARGNAERLTRENPLAAAGAAAALGLIVGLVLPETDRENRLMGEARDSVVDRAKDAARSAADRVQDAAQQAQRVATDVITATERPGERKDDEGA
jgi:ElaB/YqjD/DUF883 family membrane-anchored ribosome-binding protein